MAYKTTHPHYDATRDEWQQRTGPNTWRVWKHGANSDDDARWLAEAEAELAREQRVDAQSRGR